MEPVQEATKNKKQRGQSLTEVALFLPLFLILIAGVTEMGQYLITANRISTAARAGTRFGANGGQDQGIRDVVLNSVTQTLPLDENLWDVWSIRGTVNATGTGFSTWQFTPIYGLEQTQGFANVDEEALRTQVLRELQRDENAVRQQTIAAGTEFVGSFVSYDAESILGLEEFLGDVYTVSDWNIMRTFPFVPSTTGCDAFPISIGDGIRNVTNEASFPAASDFHYPEIPEDIPTYFETVSQGAKTRSLDQSVSGDIYFIEYGTASNDFGWLVWNDYGDKGLDRLRNSLAWPGNSKDYKTTVGGTWSDSTLTAKYGADPIVGYINPNLVQDSEMSIGDGLVRDTSAAITSLTLEQIRSSLQDHVRLERVLRVPVNELSSDPLVPNDTIKIFILIRILGYRIAGGNSWLLFEVVDIDESCGQK